VKKEIGMFNLSLIQCFNKGKKLICSIEIFACCLKPILPTYPKKENICFALVSYHHCPKYQNKNIPLGQKHWFSLIVVWLISNLSGAKIKLKVR